MNLPEEVKNKIDEWLYGYKWKLLHFWKYDGTYLCVVFFSGRLHCLRLFRLDDNWMISVDYQGWLFYPDDYLEQSGDKFYFVPKDLEDYS